MIIRALKNKIRTDPLWQGMASLALQEPAGEYPRVMYSLIENTLISNYTHLQSLSNQSAYS